MPKTIKDLEEWFERWYEYTWSIQPQPKEIIEVKEIIKDIKKCQKQNLN